MTSFPALRPLLPLPRKPPVLLADAARRAFRSLSWVRTHRAYGPLEPAEIDGKPAVTAESLEALLAAMDRKRPRLRLVIDNTTP